MITRKGTHKCERCGILYDWIAKRTEKDEIFVGDFNDIKCYNIQFFDIINGQLIASGCCPECGYQQEVLNEDVDYTR